MLFRLQKYKKFESNSQLNSLSSNKGKVVSTAKVQKIWEQFTTSRWWFQYFAKLFRLQKYKKFESNSQQGERHNVQDTCCFDCKSTKNLRAIHNISIQQEDRQPVVSTAKVQKIWEQFTTCPWWFQYFSKLFRLQKYKKFESNSQLDCKINLEPLRCFDCKSTKNLRAIHNESNINPTGGQVVSTAKVQKIWEQFTTWESKRTYYRSCFDCKSTKNLRAIHNAHLACYCIAWLFRLQKYKKFESNSQLMIGLSACSKSCFDCKSTKNLRAIHNQNYVERIEKSVVSTAKVKKIWEQFTTCISAEQQEFRWIYINSTKKLRVYHNAIYLQRQPVRVVSTAKVQKIWEQFTTHSL